MNLERAFGIQNGAVAYAYCELQCEQPGESHVRALANDTTLVRLNGEAVGSMANLTQARRDLPVLPFPLRAGRNACLLKLKGGRSEWGFLFQPLPPTRAIVDLQVADPAQRNVAGALVQFYSNGQVAARIETDESGKAAACLYPLAESYDLRVISGDMGTWLFDLTLQPGERRRLDVRLTNAVSIAGQVLAMDSLDRNGHVFSANVRRRRIQNGGLFARDSSQRNLWLCNTRLTAPCGLGRRVGWLDARRDTPSRCRSMSNSCGRM